MLRFFIMVAILLLVGGTMPLLATVDTGWELALAPASAGIGGRGLLIGSIGSYTDGYDSGREQPIIAGGIQGIYMLIHHENGTDWSGDTAFYNEDFRSAIPLGGSKTWSNIHLFAQLYTPPENTMRVGIASLTPWPIPVRVGQLVLDYVPPELNWTGPTEFWLDLTEYQEIILPIPVVDNPYELYPQPTTRMHLTVYAIPEPSSLLALGLAASGLGVGLLRRRRT